LLSDKTVKYSGEKLIAKPITKVLKGGPNGKPKWQTAGLEAYALMNSEISDHFHDLCLNTGNIDLYTYVKDLADQQSNTDRIRIRYILSIPDKGNKSRVVAISDYWTQLILRPIMEDVQNHIKHRFKGRVYSHDHELGFNAARDASIPGFKSYDMTS